MIAQTCYWCAAETKTTCKVLCKNLHESLNSVSRELQWFFWFTRKEDGHWNGSHTNNIKLSTKGRVYSAAVRSVLLYGSETWPLKAEDIRRLSVFDHRCLRSIGKIWWEHRISNTEVRRRVLGPKNMSIIEQLHNHRLRWLGHVLRMSDDRLPRRALFTEPKVAGKGPQVVSIWPGKGTWNP